jgi:hypothetical protein
MSRIFLNRKMLYPTIYAVSLSVALDGGCINRAEPYTFFDALYEEVLGADNVDEVDLAELEVYLTKLTPEERELIAIGEVTERHALVQGSPLTSDGLPSALIFDVIWEELNK